MRVQTKIGFDEQTNSENAMEVFTQAGTSSNYYAGTRRSFKSV